MMRQMREATKPIMLLAAIAFVGLMVFQWGMDITGRSGGAIGEIGTVNGDPVMYEEYMAVYRRLYDQVQRSQEEMISSQQNAELEDAAFDEVVNQLLIRQELTRRGITVTDQEISEAAQFSPPEEFRASFTDESGGLDLAAYQSALAAMTPDQLLLLEAYYRDVIPRGKLLRQVSSGIYVSDSELWQQYRDRNEQVEIRYVPMDPGARYPAEEFTVTPAEIEAYYRANQDEFEIPARATIRVTVLDKTPTAADTTASEQRAINARQEILDGTDFAEVAERESADAATAAGGGELGVFGRDMTPPFDSAVYAAPIGEVVGPVRSSFGYHVIEVLNRWAADSAEARHILIPFARTDDSEIELLTLADSLEDLSESMPLEQAAAAAGLTSTVVDISRDFPFVAGAGQVSEGADWLFEEAAPGDVSPVFETGTAFYAMELIDSQPEGVLPLDDVTTAIESTLLFERQLSRAQEEARTAAARIAGGEPIANVASDLGLELRTAGPFSRSDFVPGIGRQNAAIGAAFGLEPGEVSGVVTTPTNAYLIESIARTPADSVAWRTQIATQRRAAVGAEQQVRLQEWIDALRSAARIVDRRDIVLAPQDPDAVQMPLVF
jgi:parvulin-like peptidyl-prolyl isomerase